MSIRIMHLIDTDRVCGPGKTIIESGQSLKNSNYILTIGAFNYRKERENRYLSVVKELGFDQILIPVKSQFDPFVITKLIGIIKNKRIDILHTHGYKADFFGLIASKFCRIKAISTVHGWIQNNFRARLYVLMDKLALKFFDQVIAVSNLIRNDLIKAGVKEEKITTIHNAINLENYRSDISNNYLKLEYGIPIDSKIIGTVGRLSKEKGQKDFLEAGKILMKSISNCYFFIIGDGPDIEKLVNYSKLLGLQNKVIFTGYKNNMPDVYESIDILVNASYTEGLPNVILEAMAMHKTVVATDVGGVSEIIRHGKTGMLVKPGHPGEIARSIKKLIENEDLRMNLVRNGRKLIEKQFTFEQRINKVKKIYFDLYR